MNHMSSSSQLFTLPSFAPSQIWYHTSYIEVDGKCRRHTDEQ